MTLHCVTHSLAETQAAGRQLASVLSSGDVMLLQGPLGAGKTAFTQGVAQGLGVTERVTSPTFTVVREHHTNGHATIRKLLHADLYRTTSLDEVFDLALGEQVEDGGVACVEWGDMAPTVFGRDVMTLTIDVLDEDERRLTLDAPSLLETASILTLWSVA